MQGIGVLELVDQCRRVALAQLRQGLGLLQCEVQAAQHVVEAEQAALRLELLQRLAALAQPARAQAAAYGLQRGQQGGLGVEELGCQAQEGVLGHRRLVLLQLVVQVVAAQQLEPAAVPDAAQQRSRVVQALVPFGEGLVQAAGLVDVAVQARQRGVQRGVQRLPPVESIQPDPTGVLQRSPGPRLERRIGRRLGGPDAARQRQAQVLPELIGKDLRILFLGQQEVEQQRAGGRAVHQLAPPPGLRQLEAQRRLVLDGLQLHRGTGGEAQLGQAALREAVDGVDGRFVETLQGVLQAGAQAHRILALQTFEQTAQEGVGVRRAVV